MKHIICVLLAVSAHLALAAEVPMQKTHTCKAGDETRKIEIVPLANGENGGCKVVYTHDGQAKDVATAEHKPEVCDQVADKLLKKLQAAKFECDAPVTTPAATSAGKS